MRSTQPFLEILIPTYRRPESAIVAIRSVLKLERPDVVAFCQSNGFEPSIAALAQDCPRLRYHHFGENRGAVVNFRELIRASEADYVMFLSDEDVLDAGHLAALIEHLASHAPTFTFCDVEENGRPYFSMAGLGVERLTAEQVTLLFPIDPTYISGYCYRRDAISDALLDMCFEESAANAYPHVLLRNALMRDGKLSVFAQPVVRKGEEAATGGDSHAHLAGPGSASGRQPLNPRVYGAQARMHQYFYVRQHLRNQFSHLPRLSRAFVHFYLLAAWARITNDANGVTNQDFHYQSHSAARADLLSGSARMAIDEVVYLRLVTLRPRALRDTAIRFASSIAKAIKLAILTRHFGPARAARFLTTRRA